MVTWRVKCSGSLNHHLLHIQHNSYNVLFSTLLAEYGVVQNNIRT